jgi:hypothetical protein
MSIMPQRYEYKFVRLEEFRLGPKWLGIASLATPKALGEYPEVVHAHAREGWRLVQVFTPGTHTLGNAGYIELIFERPVQTADTTGQQDVSIPTASNSDTL